MPTAADGSEEGSKETTEQAAIAQQTGRSAADQEVRPTNILKTSPNKTVNRGI